jgi:Zn-finger nucleic acid-binding protein
VICLGCGGVVDEGHGVPPGATLCHCPPPSVEVHAIACPSCGGALRVGARACPYCRSTLATTRCPSCFAWNLAEAQHCQACGRELGTDAPGTPTSLACPRCGGALVARRYHDLDAEECDACGGFLLSRQTMDRLVASRDIATGLRLALPARSCAREAQVRYIRCPVCQSSMNREAFGRVSGVVVDVCRRDGVWFDPGELAAVLAFVEQGGLERARAREVAELSEAVRELRVERAASTLGDLSQAGGLETSGAARTGIGADFVQALAGLWR